MPVRRGMQLLPWLARTLGEQTRHRVYLAVQAAGHPLTRPEVADAVGIRARLAAFHLDKLADEGFLHVSYARPQARPGAPTWPPAPSRSPSSSWDRKGPTVTPYLNRPQSAAAPWPASARATP